MGRLGTRRSASQGEGVSEEGTQREEESEKKDSSQKSVWLCASQALGGSAVEHPPEGKQENTVSASCEQGKRENI